MPVRDTAPQKSGPPRSPESSCLVPEGLPPSWISPRRLRYIALHPLLLETAPPPFCLSSRRAAFAVLRPQPRSAPVLSSRRPTARQRPAPPVAFHRPEERAVGGWEEFEGGRPLCALAKGAFPPQQNTRLTPRCPAPRHAASGPAVRRPPRSGDRDGRTDARPPAARARSARH